MAHDDITARLANQQILIGVTGGIAAYKTCELVRRLRELGGAVRVVMTQAARGFVTPATFQALSGHPVWTTIAEADAGQGMGHIRLARWADAVLIAPATADCMARLAQGRADDLLSTLCLATDAPVLLAPAMNPNMWAHPATQANAERLRGFGVRLAGPGAGDTACGEAGEGRMVETAELLRQLARCFESHALDGCRVLITAGPTREPIDAVRFLSNCSSGKMGFALAQAAAEAGARVTLVSGPVVLPTPPRVERIDVVSAEQMHAAVIDRVGACDVFIAAAAVADYRTDAPIAGKRKKSAAPWELRLIPTPDILASVGGMPQRPFTVGFAAETERLVENAQEKRRCKAADVLAANHVGDGIGFDTDDNALEVFWDGGGAALALTSKTKLARQLVEIVAQRYRAKYSS